MPPKRRQNAPAARDAHSPNPHDDDNDENTDDQTLEEGNVLDHASVPFYSTTFSAHRVSPLYLGNEVLTTPRLQLLAQRLRDRLVGDVVRGVEVGMDGDALISRAGALEGVEMRWVGVADVLGFPLSLDVDGDDLDSAAARLRGQKALHIALRYEMASCTALLLPPLTETGQHQPQDSGQTRFFIDPSSQLTDPSQFILLPLLLLRMPAPLKSIISEFLATTFDCRVSSMRLGTRSLVHSWESWIRAAGVPSRGPLAKDAVLSLGFYIPPKNESSTRPTESLDGEEGKTTADQPLGLKSVDVIIPAVELRRFVAAGKRLAQTQDSQSASSAAAGWENDDGQRSRLAGRLHEEGWGWRTSEGSERQPFTEALACYLKEHLALNLRHPGVRLVKIACGGFVMSETRLKVFTLVGADETGGGQQLAVLELLGLLTDKAQIQVVE